jgi:D-galactarolactone isomerase
MEAPLNACDSHIHIYDTTTLLVPWTTTPGPAWATVSGYRDVQKRLGLTRAVVVQANAYGTDNTCTVNAIAELGLDKARGVATVDADVTDAELRGRHSRCAWHIVLQMDGRFLHEREAMLRNLPCTLVIDHIGKFLEPATVDNTLARVEGIDDVLLQTARTFRTGRVRTLTRVVSSGLGYYIVQMQLP